MGQEEEAKAIEGEEFEFELPKPGNQPVFLEVVEYIKYFFERGYSKERIVETLNKTYTLQQIENALSFYEKFFKK